MLINWFRKLRMHRELPGGRKPLAKPGTLRSPLLLERLEDRCVPSTFTVMNTLPSGAGSLAAAVTSANQDVTGTPITINFDPTVFASLQTIVLTATLDLNNTTAGASISIEGPAAGVTIAGGTPTSQFLWWKQEQANLDGLTISNGAFTGGSGGGINNAGILTLNDCLVANNSVEDGGAGIETTGTLTVTDTTISNNNAGGIGGIGGKGGGIDNEAGMATIMDSTVDNNSAEGGGGIFNAQGASLNVINSTISGNTAIATSMGMVFGEGGGICNMGTATITNCTISGNQSNDGGGVHCNGVATLNNTIVANSTNSDLVAATGSTFTGSNDLIGDGSELTDFTNARSGNAGLDPNGLQNNGGPTQTIALVAGSLALNAGNNSLAVDANGNPLTTDQRGAGFVRIVNNTVDIGAFEVQSSPTETSVFATGPDAGGGPDVTVFDGNGDQLYKAHPYDDGALNGTTTSSPAAFTSVSAISPAAAAPM